MGITAFPNGISSFGVPIFGTRQDISGNAYFVENNSGNDGNDGSSWARAFKTLARAITISNLDITGSFAARRNTIYFVGDLETTTLAAFPNKCDVIGCGSYDANTKAGILGNHAPVNAGNYGTRFINVWFKGVAAAAPIIDLVSSSSGVQFVNCTGDGDLGTVTCFVRATASPFLKVIDCDVFGGFATNYFAFGVGDMAGTLIQNTTMAGLTGIGIATVDTTTSSYASYVKDCIITVGGNNKCVNDVANSDAGILYFTNNRCMSTGATVSAIAHHAAVLNINLTRAAGNICMGSGTQQVTCPTFVAT